MKRDANFVCLPAKIKDGHVEQVRAILGSYEYEGMVADVKEQESGWFLDFSEESEETAELWAVRRQEVPAEDKYPDAPDGGYIFFVGFDVYFIPAQFPHYAKQLFYRDGRAPAFFHLGLHSAGN